METYIKLKNEYIIANNLYNAKMFVFHKKKKEIESEKGYQLLFGENEELRKKFQLDKFKEKVNRVEKKLIRWLSSKKGFEKLYEKGFDKDAVVQIILNLQ